MVTTRQLLFLCAYGVATLCYSTFSLPISIAHEINDIYLRQLLKNMNTSYNPCNDFYSYACGNWANHIDMPPYVDMPGYMNHKVNLQLLETLEPVKAGRILPQAKAYFQSCLELEWTHRRFHLNRFLRLVETNHNFKWPIFYGSNVQKLWPNATRFDWLPVLAGLRLYGLNGIFITQNINTQQNNGSHYLIELRAHQQETQLDQRQVADIFMRYGLRRKYAESLSKKVCDLEKDLEGLSVLPQLDIDNIANMTRQTVNVTSLEMSLTDLEFLVPQMDWRAYFVELLGPSVNLTRLHLQTFAHNLPYFRQLSSKLYKVYSNTTIAHYIMLKLMNQFAAYVPISTDSSMQCVRLLRDHMPLAANYLYEMNHYNYKRGITDSALQAMYKRLCTQFQQLMDESDREFIDGELLSMELKIGNGNIPKAEDGTHLEALVTRYYSELHMNESDFYGNHLQLLKINVRRMQARLANTPSAVPVDFYENDFDMSTSSSPVKIFNKTFLVPNGYLQMPLYDHRLDDVYQYSLFGFMLAHEMTHAFDLLHAAYDASDLSHQLAYQVAQHYSSYVNCSGDQVSENMADVVGLLLAYETYFNITATKDGRTTVNSNNLTTTSNGHAGGNSDDYFDGINFTRPQLFFINSVQFLCANMQRIVTTGLNELNLGHFMYEYDVRVRRNWAKVEYFAKAFQCASGTKMNPIDKCW